MTRAHRALLLVRTARRLRPSQLVHRARLRALRAAVARLPEPFAHRWRRPIPDDPGWPSGFVPLDASISHRYPSPEANVALTFEFLGEIRNLGQPPRWEPSDASQLWRFHLHYLEWAWSFAADPDRARAADAFSRLWRAWRAGTRLGRGDAWAPYVASVRAWGLCGVYHTLVAGRDDEGAFLHDLALHAGFVAANLELDVGGNHLVKNLKALVGLGVFLRDDRLLDLASRHLERQVAIQVLGDGGHFERSPSYHCQVLGDLIDMASLLDAARRPVVPGLDDAVQRMRSWLGTVLMPDGDVPLFNDCTLVGADRIAGLRPAAPPSGRLVVLEPSGYVVVRPDDRTHLVADVGDPCPDELPAHAHADCLSFELAVDGRRVVVDTGTSTYAPGPRRAYERSTRAHNTVELDGADQTEVWDTFRAARRARPHLERAGEDGCEVEVVASHDGYTRLRPPVVHRRAWHVGRARVILDDELTGVGTHRVVASLHLAPEISATVERDGRVRAGPLSLVFRRLGVTTASDVLHATVTRGLVATGFGECRPACTIEVTLEGSLPLGIRTEIRVQPNRERAGAGS